MNFKSLCWGLIILITWGCAPDRTSIEEQKDKATISPLFSGGELMSILQVEELNEASGLAQSTFDESLFWSHNDSGGDPALYLFNVEGQQQMKIFLAGAKNVDWEDIAIGPGPEEGINYLYVGDIGDNQAVREDLTIYRFPEPNIQEGEELSRIDRTTIERINFVYEDGARDAETLLVDPLTNHIYVVTKREPKVLLYKLPFPQSTIEQDTAIRVATLPYTYMTAGDISRDGQEILIKNYLNVYYWQRSVNEPLEHLLNQRGLRLAYDSEPQGEAIAWSNNTSAFYTISEKSNADQVELLRYSRR